MTRRGPQAYQTCVYGHEPSIKIKKKLINSTSRNNISDNNSSGIDHLNGKLVEFV